MKTRRKATREVRGKEWERGIKRKGASIQELGGAKQGETEVIRKQ